MGEEETKREETECEATAREWGTARSRYLASLSAVGNATKAMQEAESAEAAAWRKLLHVAERDTPDLPGKD